MDEDWNFVSEDKICALRAAGILIWENKILLDHVLDSNEYWLPGGHIQIGETSEMALHREFREEFDCEIQVEKLNFVSENFWHWHEFKTSFVQFEYDISVRKLNLDFDKKEPNVEKVWISLSEITDLLLVPNDLKERLKRRN